ncbi:hypothetical protein Tco_0282008, partial [Tanacetum coccineum]
LVPPCFVIFDLEPLSLSFDFVFCRFNLTNPVTTSTTDSQMHNNIMTSCSRDRPTMLATGRYAQWQSRFLRCINTRPNGDTLRKCILQGPYITSTFIIPAEPTTDDSP